MHSSHDDDDDDINALVFDLDTSPVDDYQWTRLAPIITAASLTHPDCLENDMNVAAVRSVGDGHHGHVGRS